MNKQNIYDVWFPKSTREIIIIVSEEAETKKSEDASTTSENYAYLDNVGDKDTLFEVAIFLAKHYPRATLKRLFPREFNEREDLSKNLVIIGGPAHNYVYTRFQQKIKTSISYDLEKWTIALGSKTFESLFTDEKGMEEDYGSFSTFHNPFMYEHKVVLINGISTFGALGAFYAFSDRDEAVLNYKYICNKYSNMHVGFETLVCVKVHNCFMRDCTKVNIDCPQIDPNNTVIHSSYLHEEGRTLKSIKKNKVDIGIITVIDEETMAVATVLGLKEQQLSLGDRLFYSGSLRNNLGRNLSIVLTQQLSQGESSVVAAFNSVHTNFSPSFLFLVGIAGGISSDVDYCSVVIANQVVGYDLAKDRETGICRRGEVYRIDPLLVPVIQQTLHRASVTPLCAANGSKMPNISIQFGDLASGSVVITNSASSIIEWIRKFNDKVLAVEMEGYGFNVASYEHKLNGIANQNCTTCVIRGISDLADERKAEVTRFRKPAAENAAIVLREIAKNIP